LGFSERMRKKRKKKKKKKLHNGALQPLDTLALLGALWQRLLVVSSDFAHEFVEGLVDVDLLLGRRLDELAAK